MTATTPATRQSLEQRITARLHESIGDLITDDDLKGIVEAGVHDFFFKPRQVPSGSYRGYDTEPPLMQVLVERALKDRMQAAVDAWLGTHTEAVKAAMDEGIKLGAAGAMMAVINAKFEAVFAGAVYTLQQQGKLPLGPTS